MFLKNNLYNKKVTSFSIVNFSNSYIIVLKDGKHGGLYINWPQKRQKKVCCKMSTISPGQIKIKLPNPVSLEKWYEILLLGQINMQASFHK